MTTDTIWPDLATGENFDSFACYVDRRIKGRENLRQFKKLKNVSQLAELWIQQLNPNTWGHNYTTIGGHRWDTTILNHPREMTLGGRTMDVAGRALTSDDILRSFCSMARTRNDDVRHGALATCDGFHPAWNKYPLLGTTESACVPCLRIDIDSPEILTTKLVRAQIRCIQTVAKRFSMPWSVFETGGRGIQAIFRIPNRVTTVVGVLLVDALKEALRQELAAKGVNVHVDCDNIRRLMRLPFGRHGLTRRVGFFLSKDGDRHPDRTQLAIGRKCFAPAAADNPLIARAQEVCAGLNPDVIPSDTDLPSLVLRFGTECLLFAPVGHSTVINDLEDVTTSQTPVVTENGFCVNSDIGSRDNIRSDIGSRTRSDLLAICNQHVDPGTVWHYITHWGYHAHLMVYGVEGEARYRAKLAEVPGWHPERQKDIEWSIATYKRLSPDERKEYKTTSSLPKEFHPDDTAKALAFADTVDCRSQRRRNLNLVKQAELHVLRFAPHLHISGLLLSRVLKSVLGAGAPSKTTCAILYWEFIYNKQYIGGQVSPSLNLSVEQKTLENDVFYEKLDDEIQWDEDKNMNEHENDFDLGTSETQPPMEIRKLTSKPLPPMCDNLNHGRRNMAFRPYWLPPNIQRSCRLNQGFGNRRGRRCFGTRNTNRIVQLQRPRRKPW